MFSRENKENEFFERLSFRMMPESLAVGKVLISEPFMSDPNFSRTVVLLVQYDRFEGAVGIIINKPTALDVTKVVDPFPTKGHQLYYGGPVSQDNMLFIHNQGYLIHNTEKVEHNLFWGGDFERAKELIALGKIGANEIKFFSGYSGWSPGQLEEELKENAWIISDIDGFDIFNTDPLKLWKKAMQRLGAQYSVMANFPEDPQLN